MKVYLAGGSSAAFVRYEDFKFNRLVSFFYKQADEEFLHLYSDVFLDSGAFSTFRFPEKFKNIDWWEYLKNYANFIKKHNISKFLELDIDNLVGTKKVEEFRDYLENRVGAPCIPVWHSVRKWSGFRELCHKYKYVAIGTTPHTSQGRVLRKHPQILREFYIDYAHNHGCKIHGLGFTPSSKINSLAQFRFDSVDSTSWLSGCRFGCVHKFHQGAIVRIKRPAKTRCDFKKLARYNFLEWRKFCEYAEKNF
jgi:hypothetical protein